MLHVLQSVSKWIALGSLLLLLLALFNKDQLPEPDYYQHDRLTDPVQRPTLRKPFSI
jgi:hypothetical protein